MWKWVRGCGVKLAIEFTDDGYEKPKVFKSMRLCLVFLLGIVIDFQLHTIINLKHTVMIGSIIIMNLKVAKPPSR
jgi:hypothetical protein